MIPEAHLVPFLDESNRIEGIHKSATYMQIAASLDFLQLKHISVQDVCNLVNVFSPGAELRDRPGMDVRVGKYVPLRGGPGIKSYLAGLLQTLDLRSAYWTHGEYESLHPFMDGNGRSGRMIWLWQMQREGYDGSLGFLHKWYYQSLEAGK